MPCQHVSAGQSHFPVTVLLCLSSQICGVNENHCQCVFGHGCVFPHMGGTSVVFSPSVTGLINEEIENRS